MSNAKPKARPAKASPAKTARKHRASAPRPERHNQWTRQKMRAFLAALAGTASVTDAARAVGMSRQSAYQLRARLVGPPFDIAWEVALEHGLQQLATAALERASLGVPLTHYFQGEKNGVTRGFNISPSH